MTSLIHGARCAMGPDETIDASIEVRGGHIARIRNHSSALTLPKTACTSIDLSGFLLMPGLINSHDHLQFSLFPRLGNPPYQNYIEWGRNIHSAFPELIALHKTVPRRARLWWGGIKNLLCGVTTVCHHDPLWPELRQNDFPIQVLQGYGWAHSLALGGDLRAARAATPAGCPFIVHACEGVDEQSRMELWHLDRIGQLDADTILVHALALDPKGADLVRKRSASTIVCPSSNHFLFGTTPQVSLLSGINKVALGNDSPLTAAGDLLDEVRFATQTCDISPQDAYRMVTTVPAEILRLTNSAGSIRESGAADLIAVRDTGASPAGRLKTISMKDIELVMIRGSVRLSSHAMLERLPPSARQDLESLSINGTTRWLRTPVSRLLEQAEEWLGQGNVRLQGKPVCIQAETTVSYAC